MRDEGGGMRTQYVSAVAATFTQNCVMSHQLLRSAIGFVSSSLIPPPSALPS